MPLDELSPSDPAAIDWPEIDRRLFGEGRPQPPPFPLHLLPAQWRAWVEASVESFIPADYFAQVQLGAVSGVVVGGMRAKVTPQWAEPLVLWHALAGGPASGKSRALVMGQRLIEVTGLRAWAHAQREAEADEEVDSAVVPQVLGDCSPDFLKSELAKCPRGLSMWREDLGDWMAGSARAEWRPAWLAAWNAGDVMIDRRGYLFPFRVERFAVCVTGTLQPERLPEILGGDSEALAAQFLYTWPEPGSYTPLGQRPPDTVALDKLLQRIAWLAPTARSPATLPFEPEAVARLDRLLPDLHRRKGDADDVEAAWIGKGPSTIVRLAAMLELMHWAQDRGEDRPAGIRAERVDDAHALWSGYYLPHAQAVFAAAGTTDVERMVRRAVGWLRRHPREQVSLLNIRREALAQKVDAEGAEEVMGLLEAAGAVRALPVPEGGGRGRRPLRWAVNPALK